LIANNVRLQLTQNLIRPLQATDAPSIATYANNRKIWLNLRDAFPHPYTLEDARQFIQQSTAKHPQTVFAITVDHQAVGCIGLGLRQDVERISAEIGYWIGEPFWNKGMMTEIVDAVSVHTMKVYQLQRLYALPFEWNTASCRVLQKAGYTLEARLRKSAIKDGKVLDQFLYARIED
jgi:ribosomal-protein-alanine N-acetyltransferase